MFSFAANELNLLLGQFDPSDGKSVTFLCAINNNNIIFKARTDADMMPYQYSSDMRGERTLQFYRNLNLEACIWEFENWFSMSELQQACGGEITTDGQVSFYS